MVIDRAKYMSQKEVYRLYVMQVLINKNITQKKAADIIFNYLKNFV